MQYETVCIFSNFLKCNTNTTIQYTDEEEEEEDKGTGGIFWYYLEIANLRALVDLNLIYFEKIIIRKK